MKRKIIVSATAVSMVLFSVAPAKENAKPLSPQCGQYCVYHVCQLLGVPSTLDQILKCFPPKDQGDSLLDISDALQGFGIECKGRRYSLNELTKSSFPLVAHLHRNIRRNDKIAGHFVVVESASSSSVKLYFGNGTTCKNSCCDKWTCERCDISTQGCSPCLRKESYANLTNSTKCPYKVQDPNRKTITCNGCGPEGGPQFNPNPMGCTNGVSFLQSCNRHDICFGTCLPSESHRKGCNQLFHENMYEACTECVPAGQSFAYWANIYANVVQIIGVSAYTSAQEVACACCDCGAAGVVPVPQQGCQ